MKFMNNILISSLLAIPMMSNATSMTFEADVPVDHVYSPAGFNSNDNAEVVVTGFLPNLCYKIPKSTVAIKDGKINVSVKATRNQVAMGFCADVIIPYIEFINLGVLDKGKYQIAVNEKSTWEKQSNMMIAEASSSSIGETIYANVDTVSPGEEGTRKVYLKGYNPSDCFELKEIAVIDNGVDTYTILPKMKQVKQFCPKKMIPFTYEFEVPQNLDAERLLLNVRVMDGRSVNAFYNNKPQDL